MKSLKSSVHNNVHAMSPRPNSAPIQIQNILHTTNMPGPLLVKTGALWQGIRADRAKCWLPGTQCEKNAVRAKFSFFACYNLDIECILCIIVNNAASSGASIGQDTGALTPWTLLLFTDTLTQQQCFITIQFNALKTHQGEGGRRRSISLPVYFLPPQERARLCSRAMWPLPCLSRRPSLLSLFTWGMRLSPGGAPGWQQWRKAAEGGELQWLGDSPAAGFIKPLPGAGAWTCWLQVKAWPEKRGDFFTP